MTKLIPGQLYQPKNQRIMDWSCYTWDYWNGPVMFIGMRAKRENTLEYIFLVETKKYNFHVANNYECKTTGVHRIQFESNLTLIGDKMVDNI